jgi:carbon monoxide dehydrogenase subunit G
VSNLKIEERFQVAAPPERVFAFLSDPQSVVVCMPGAELESVESERRFLGRVTVKVGAVQVAYKGAVELSVVDAAARHLHAVGEGREQGGAGKVSLALELRVSGSGAGSEVVLEAEASLAGRIVRFGRGMIESVSRQLFAQFAAAARERLEAAPDAAAPAPPAAPGPIRALPLLWRALLDWLRRLFGGAR